MIYGVNDKLSISKLSLFSLQIMLSVFTATVLIANVCGVNTPAALVGAGLSTIVYVIVTNFQSPMFISNSGNYVTPVIAALALGGYTAVFIGGLISAVVYCVFGVIFSRFPAQSIYKIFPKVLIGSVTIVIGINLMSFIPSYIGESQVGLIVALVTVLAIALSSNYLKGSLSLFPFLIGTLVGYLVSIPLGLVDFSVFNNVNPIQMPDFAFTNFEKFSFSLFPTLLVLYLTFTISAQMECLSDHAALGNIIDKDLYKEPGLSKIFIGEGIANVVGTFFGGLGQCSYGEGIAAVGFSKCASIYATLGASVLLITLGFIGPIQAFISSIPTAVIGGGNAIILYGFIANSGIKQLQQVDFSKQKNLIISSVVLSLGICGIALGNSSLSISGTALGLIVGVVLNIILAE